jgi:hypothetical protein
MNTRKLFACLHQQISATRIIMEKHFSVEGLYQENKKINAVRRIVHNNAYLVRAHMVLC